MSEYGRSVLGDMQWKKRFKLFKDMDDGSRFLPGLNYTTENRAAASNPIQKARTRCVAACGLVANTLDEHETRGYTIRSTLSQVYSIY